ncbi:hypothetical protein BDF14DRAFT_1851170 [Spinellus fusiger]|nr:hypothetical protein BDF14DRAFT_1851170 [Spinellus fusiger]
MTGERWVDGIAHSVQHQTTTATRLTLTAIAASVLTASGILSYQSLQRHRRTRALQAHETVAPRKLSSPKSAKHWTPQEIDTQLSKNTAFLGKEGMEKVRSSFVIVVGAGGVGSWTALMLLYSGVQHIRIIDFDQVTLSSLNRHAVATLEDVGTPKVVAIQRHFEAIAPSVVLETHVDLLSKDNVQTLLSGNPDYVVDAIDNMETKLDLIQYCHKHHIKVMSSMGASTKADPSLIQIADISETFEDPLARTVRRKLKKAGIHSGIPVAYSAEKPHHVKLLPLEEERVAEADDYAALPDFRSRILPVLGTIPSMFGMSIATYIVLNLGKYPSFDPLAVKLRHGVYQRVHRDLMMREMKIYNKKQCLLDVHDIGYLYEQLWHGKSLLSGPGDRLTLVRWDRSQPPSYFNMVCLDKTEAKIHEDLPIDTDLLQYYGQDIFNCVKTTFDRERHLQTLWDDVL